ncbi:hypothetical protein B0H11DRAFT_2252039 [Mycena galericulata]|nr:hypothetical protein B0H11DRAFT_2252039 [Mycena galericulata]
MAHLRSPAYVHSPGRCVSSTHLPGCLSAVYPSRPSAPQTSAPTAPPFPLRARFALPPPFGFVRPAPLLQLLVSAAARWDSSANGHGVLHSPLRAPFRSLWLICAAPLIWARPGAAFPLHPPSWASQGLCIPHALLLLKPPPPFPLRARFGLTLSYLPLSWLLAPVSLLPFTCYIHLPLLYFLR